MRIIRDSKVGEYAKKYSQASSSVKNWRAVVRRANWKSFEDVKQTFRSADQITVPNGSKVVVFNIAGNAFRLVTSIHWNRGIVYIRRLLTHAQYSKGDWKNDP
ncbi:MAG: type II toxin-antitoxin system HigB family toxin [Verrucomicrobia bacterium]|nr:type II toxin-antitoxin system HigB family toxin [Verrucomicrobiota bacterium]